MMISVNGPKDRVQGKEMAGCMWIAAKKENDFSEMSGTKAEKDVKEGREE